MTKKKSGIAGALWNAWAWIALHLLHLMYLAVKAIFRATGAIVGNFSARAAKSASEAKRPRSQATYVPLMLQKKSAGDLGQFEGKFLSSKSTIGLILGARGSGKSALGMRLLENVFSKTGRRVCAMGFDESSLPSWIKCVDSVDMVPNGSVVLVDEGGITFSARSSQSSANKILSSLLLVARHKDLSVLFISQNSANLEVNAIRQADFLLLRKPSLLQQEFERKKIAEIYTAIGKGFLGLPQQGCHSTYIYSGEFSGFVSNELPSFWSQKMSKSYASFRPNKAKA